MRTAFAPIAPSVRPPFDKPVPHVPLRAQEPLPPYELDPQFDEPAVRKRIGELIGRAMVPGRVKSQRPLSGRRRGAVAN